MISNYDTKITYKILPLCDPVITTYTQHAHLLSILGNYKYVYPWIFSNYIQLYINKDFNKYNWSDFYFPFPYELRPSDTCKWIITQKIQRDVIFKKWGNIINLIIDCVNSNTYVHSMVDVFYIPNNDMYNKHHFLHDVLIFGFDIEREVIFIRDFFEHGKYLTKELSFRNIIQSFEVYDVENNPDYLNKTIFMYRINEDCDYKFSINNIIKSIESYITERIPEYWEIYNNENKDQVAFGKKIYTVLKTYVIQKTSYDIAGYIDVKPFYLLYDHKRIMTLRIRYLLDNEYLRNFKIEDIIEIEDKNYILLSLILKYNISRNTKLANKVVNLLDEIEIKEYNALKKLICYNE